MTKPSTIEPIENPVARLDSLQNKLVRSESYGSINKDLEAMTSFVGTPAFYAEPSSSEEMKPIKVADLEKTLTLFHTVSIAVGQIIGSGIFISPNVIIKGVGSMGISLIIWALGGLLSLCGALCFAELGAICPKTGGEYQYIKMTYGRMVAFSNLWVLLIVNSMAPAVISLTFSTYFLSLFIDPHYEHFEIIKKVVAAVALLVVVSICMYGTKAGVWVQNGFTITKFLALIFLVSLALAYLFRGHTENISSGFEGSNLNVSEWSGALLSSLWAYNGWTHISIVASEVKNPKKNLPRALVITGIVVLITYVVINLAYHTLLSPKDLIASESIAVHAGERFFAGYGEAAVLFGRYFFATSVALSTFGALMSITISASRLPYAGASEGMLPAMFGLVSKRSKTPVPSLAFLGTCAFVCVWPSDIGDLIQYVGFLSWIFWGLCFLAVIILRYKMPDIDRPFKVPLAIPVVALLTSLYLIGGSLYASPVTSAMWLAVALAALPVYYGYVDNEQKCDAWMKKLTAKLLCYLDAGGQD